MISYFKKNNTLRAELGVVDPKMKRGPHSADETEGALYPQKSFPAQQAGLGTCHPELQG